MRKGWCNNTRYLSQPCPSDFCSFEEIISIWGAGIAPLIPRGIFCLILKLRRSLELLRKVMIEIKMGWTILLPFTSVQIKMRFQLQALKTTGIYPIIVPIFFPNSGPISYSWEEKKGLLPKAWISAINCKSLALHSTEPHGVNISFSLCPLHLRFLGNKSITFDNLHFFHTQTQWNVQ